MRILFTAAPPDGHFYPLIPFAQAMRDAGHKGERLERVAKEQRPVLAAS